MSRHVKKPEQIEITHQVINQWIVALSRNPDKTVNFESSTLIYSVVDLTEAGVEIRRNEKRVPAHLWPQDLLKEIKVIHERLLKDADDSGMLAAGSDDDDLPEGSRIITPGTNGV